MSFSIWLIGSTCIILLQRILMCNLVGCTVSASCRSGRDPTDSWWWQDISRREDPPDRGWGKAKGSCFRNQESSARQRYQESDEGRQLRMRGKRRPGWAAPAEGTLQQKTVQEAMYHLLTLPLAGGWQLNHNTQFWVSLIMSHRITEC